MRRLLFLFVMATTTANAQEAGQEWMLDDLRVCYNAADNDLDKKACAFVVSEACQASEQGGYSTLGMSVCNSDEASAWDVLLNEEYGATMKAFKSMDADDAEYYPGLDTRVDTLRAAQRTWITFRDAECLNEFALWGTGSMRNIAYTACILDETAERTIEVWSKREAYSDEQ